MTAIPFTRDRLQALLGQIAHQRIGVVGNFTLDGYWCVDMERSGLSCETPLYPRPIIRETYSLGGAAIPAFMDDDCLLMIDGIAYKEE